MIRKLFFRLCHHFDSYFISCKVHKSGNIAKTTINQPDGPATTPNMARTSGSLCNSVPAVKCVFSFSSISHHWSHITQRPLKPSSFPFQHCFVFERQKVARKNFFFVFFFLFVCWLVCFPCKEQSGNISQHVINEQLKLHPAVRSVSNACLHFAIFFFLMRFSIWDQSYKHISMK